MLKSQTNYSTYLDLAYTYIGVKELKGKGTHPRLAYLFKASKTWITDDDIAWCAAFIAGILSLTNIPVIKGFESSLTWLNYGVKIPKPQVGALAIFKRKPSGGHIGFVVGISACGNIIYVLGGNQQDSVNISTFDLRKRQAFFRVPVGIKLDTTLKSYKPLNTASIKESSKEV
jgi:uncharacterized protein (TIGR02594 family)